MKDFNKAINMINDLIGENASSYVVDEIEYQQVMDAFNNYIKKEGLERYDVFTDIAAGLAIILRGPIPTEEIENVYRAVNRLFQGTHRLQSRRLISYWVRNFKWPFKIAFSVYNYYKKHDLLKNPKKVYNNKEHVINILNLIIPIIPKGDLIKKSPETWLELLLAYNTDMPYELYQKDKIQDALDVFSIF